jgi:hypothetical protein
LKPTVRSKVCVAALAGLVTAAIAATGAGCCPRQVRTELPLAFATAETSLLQAAQELRDEANLLWMRYRGRPSLEWQFSPSVRATEPTEYTYTLRAVETIRECRSVRSEELTWRAGSPAQLEGKVEYEVVTSSRRGGPVEITLKQSQPNGMPRQGAGGIFGMPPAVSPPISMAPDAPQDLKDAAQAAIEQCLGGQYEATITRYTVVFRYDSERRKWEAQNPRRKAE